MDKNMQLLQQHNTCMVAQCDVEQLTHRQNVSQIIESNEYMYNSTKSREKLMPLTAKENDESALTEHLFSSMSAATVQEKGLQESTSYTIQ